MEVALSIFNESKESPISKISVKPTSKYYTSVKPDSQVHLSCPGRNSWAGYYQDINSEWIPSTFLNLNTRELLLCFEYLL